MRRKRVFEKIVNRIALIYLLFMAAAGWGYSVARYEIFPFEFITSYEQELIAFVRGDTDDNDTTLTQKIVYHRQERKNKFGYSSFQRRDLDFTDTGYLLISRFDKQFGQVVVDLVRLADFSTLFTWQPPVDQIAMREKQNRASAKNASMADLKAAYRAQHPYLFPDGSLLIQNGEGSLTRIDRCNNIQWMNHEHFHHSIEMAHDGNFVVPIVNDPQLQSIPEDFDDDGYAVITPDGNIIDRYSIGKILVDNGFQGLFLGVGRFGADRIHLNDVQPIYRDHGEARVGDVALSMRHLSTVMLYRPSTNKIIRLRTGPWLNQHDVDHLDDGRFSILDNDVYRTEEQGQLYDGYIDVYIWNPWTGELSTPYRDIFEELGLRAHTNGRATILQNGDVFIEETMRGRLLRVSPEQVRWEYVNGVTDNTVGIVHWSRYLAFDQVQTSWMTGACS